MTDRLRCELQRLPCLVNTIGRSKQAIVDGRSIAQLGASTIPLSTPTSWQDHQGLPDEAIIETFLVDTDAETITALGSSSAWIERWAERAGDIARCTLRAVKEHGLGLAGPGYLTCSITPFHLLEGQAHLDDDQFSPEAGLGLVAIVGQHVAPRVAVGSLDAARPVTVGPVAFEEDTLEAFQRHDLPAMQGPVDDITLFAQFGQLHAGPRHDELPGTPDAIGYRQLMVLRCATVGGPCPS